MLSGFFFGEVAKRTDHTIVLKNLKVPYRLSIGVQWRIMGNHIGVFLLIGDHKSQGKNTYKSAGCTRVKHQAGFPDHLFWGASEKTYWKHTKTPPRRNDGRVLSNCWNHRCDYFRERFEALSGLIF
jgi:hypothetical protein